MSSDSKTTVGFTYQEQCLVLALVMLPLFAFAVIKFDEPFSLLDGISIWPAEFLKMAALWLSYFLIRRTWVKMKESESEIEKKFGLLRPEKESQDDIGSIWSRYKEYGNLKHCLNRAAPVAASWLVICWLLYFIQEPNIPFRGSGSYLFDRILTNATFAGFVILFAVVSDATMHCRRLIRKLTEVDTTGWPLMPDSRALTHDIMREWYQIRLIGMRSDVISQTIYYPVYVILILLAAYNNYFDNFDIPLSLMVIGILNISLVLIFAIMLHRAATEAREQSLKKLGEAKASLLRLRGAERKVGLATLRLYKERIVEIREGAFRPITEQPWLRALTLMTGGGSSLLLLQYLSG